MKKLILASLILFSAFAEAQDPHFSQYHSSPLTLNPAMTGFFEGDFRLSGNYRQQWWSLGTPFITGTVSYEQRIMKAKLKNDVFGIGVLGLYDQSLSGGFKSADIAVSASYHKALDAENKSKIGVGFQATYASRSINSAHLSFANQFNGNGFDSNIPSNENFGTMTQSYFDLNAGILYSYTAEKLNLYLGGSMYHIGSPNTSFLKDGNYILPHRYTVHAGSRFILGDNRNELFVGGLFMSQASATEKVIGASYGISANTSTMIYAGLSYRLEDSYIPYLGLSSGNFHLGMSYDVLTSDLKTYNPKNGSFELSLTVSGSKPGNAYSNYKK